MKIIISGFSTGIEMSGVEEWEPGRIVDEEDVNRVAMSPLIGLNIIAAQTNSVWSKSK